MKVVLQLEKTGCAIACAATLAGITYSEAKKEAKQLGITAEDERLWSDTKHMRTLLAHLGTQLGSKQRPFTSWESLPAQALLAIKWHRLNGTSFWHWTVFIRDNTGMAVLDPKRELKNNYRTDFGRIKPKWFIEVVLRRRRM